MCGKVYSSHNTPFHGCSTSSSAHHCRRRITRLSDVLNLYRVLKEMKNVRVRVFDIFLFSSLFAFGALCRSRSCATIRLGCTIFHRIRCCKTIIRTEHEQPPGRKWNSAWTSQPTTHTRIFHSIAFRVLGTVIIWSRCLAYVCRVYVCGLVFGHDSILAPVFMWSPARVCGCACAWIHSNRMPFSYGIHAQNVKIPLEPSQVWTVFSACEDMCGNRRRPDGVSGRCDDPTLSNN